MLMNAIIYTVARKYSFAEVLAKQKSTNPVREN